MFDAIERRGFSQQEVEDLAKFSGVPVWNGLTDDWHPTQMIADYMTVKEEFGYLKGLKLVYVGDGRNNMANSLIVCGAMLGVSVTIVAPDSLHPTQEVMDIANKFAAESGATALATSNIEEGVKGANVIYSDVWVSMGESNWEERVELLTPYRITMDMLKMTGNTENGMLRFMHCLPAFHDTETEYGKEIKAKYGLTEMEVTDEVFRSEYAVQFQEAENRMHSIKAIMAATLGNLFIPTVAPDWK
jgi:ornithine carbamoyltransferase